MNKCGTCKHYTGAGDFDLCCMKDIRRLTYEHYEACEQYEPNPIKHRYYIVMDNHVICHFEDKVGIHPVYAIHLMGNDLSEKMEKIDKEYWPEQLEEVRKSVKYE